MSNTAFVESTNLTASNANAISMASGDQLTVVQGVLVAANTTTVGGTFDAVHATGGVMMNIDGILSGSGNGFSDTGGSAFITIGVNGRIETQNNQLGCAIVTGAGGNHIFNEGSIAGEFVLNGTGSNLIQNSGIIQGDGYDVELAGVSNVVSNTGTIIGGNLAGDALNFSSSTVGQNWVSNSGTIAGTSGIADASTAGGASLAVTNDGFVNGSNGWGIEELSHGNLDVTNTGRITGASAGILFAGSIATDALTNSGFIGGHTYGIVEAGAATWDVTNNVGGVISGATGISWNDANSASHINNAGTVSGTTGRGMFLDEGASTATIINSGTIQSLQAEGIDVGSAHTRVTNSGMISGADGVHLEGSVTDELHNTGTIASSGAGNFAVEETGTADFTFTNSGSVIGDVILGNGTSTYDGTLGTVTGTVRAGATSSTLLGGAGVETFDVSQGSDTVNSAAGNDLIEAGANLGNVTIDGGTGADTVQLHGFYSNFTFGADTMVNVETLQLLDGFLYKLTTDDETVGAGQRLIVNASALTGAHTLTFDGSAETDGKFVVTGGSGNDSITTSVGNDIVNGGSGNDAIMPGAGNDIVGGNNGNDSFVFAGNLTAADRVDGGAGTDKLSLAGDYSGAKALTLGAATLVNVETLLVAAGHNYAVTTNDATVAAGQTLTVNASALAAANTLTFNGAAEKDGHFKITGGLGADVLTGGKLSDTFIYTKAGQSSSAHHDTINSFSYTADKIDVAGTIGAIDTKVSHTVSTASFDTDIGASATSAHLLAHTAMLVTANAGTLSGHSFLVVDLNGTAGYQAGADLVIDMHGATGTLATSDFI